MPALPAFFQTDARIIHAPWLVRSHRRKGYHVLLQDALYQLYLIDPTGKLIWKKMLEGPITTDVFEVDFYKNNKIQYGFGTDSQLHLVDYHGSEVSKYPHNLPQLSTHLKVIDYDHSKDYRLLIATAKGDVYLKDKQYRPLPAWDPKALGSALTSTPFHIRVQGKDYFLALQTNGVLQALNRKGQYYPGFPVDLNSPVHSPLLVHKGQTAPETTFLVLTEMGKLVHLNLAGQIQKIVQLNGHRVVICPSRTLSGGHVIVSREADKVMVIDAALNLLFEFPYSAQGLLAQYYDLGNGLQFYAFTDPDQQCTYIYDHTGKPLPHTPLQSAYKVALIFSKEKHQLEVYSCGTTQCMKNIIPLGKLIQ